MPDPRRGSKSQGGETDRQDETPQDHLGHSEGKHDPGSRPKLPEPRQAAGQGRRAQRVADWHHRGETSCRKLNWK